MMDFKHRLPISADWLRELDKAGATNPFKGSIKEYSEAIAKPFWCRQLQKVLPNELLSSLSGEHLNNTHYIPVLINKNT